MATSSDTSEQNGVKSRRPAESAFKQQRLPAWQPILTAGTVLPTFFVIGIAFIPVGIGLLYFSDEVKEFVKDYTFCERKDMNITCADYIKQNMDDSCICELTFNLTEDFKSDVYFYYGLSNYYQNHRRYVKSRDDNQLLGRLGTDPSSDCDPFAWGMENGVKKPIAPCGAIANSLFNDSLSLYSIDLDREVPVNRTGIAWSSDKNIKFRNPDGVLEKAFANYTKPSNWRKNVWELDPLNPENNGFQNEDLIVWMRTAALPTFRKLYRRVDHEQEGFRKGLSKGTYKLTIEYNYPVTDFDGRKSFIISTTSLLGGKNPFLGVAYVVVGTLCLLLGIVLLIIHVRCSKRYYPTPTDSIILDIDAMYRSDRRLEALRAINLAYTASNVDHAADTISPPDDKKKGAPSVKIAPDSKPNDHENTSDLDGSEPTKLLIRDSAEYNPQEKAKLERAAEALRDTEMGWTDYSRVYENVERVRRSTSNQGSLQETMVELKDNLQKREEERERLKKELRKYDPNKPEFKMNELNNDKKKDNGMLIELNEGGANKLGIKIDEQEIDELITLNEGEANDIKLEPKVAYYNKLNEGEGINIDNSKNPEPTMKQLMIEEPLREESEIMEPSGKTVIDTAKK